MAVGGRCVLNVMCSGDVYGQQAQFRVRCIRDAISVVIEVDRPDGQCESIASFDPAASDLIGSILDLFAPATPIPLQPTG